MNDITLAAVVSLRIQYYCTIGCKVALRDTPKEKITTMIHVDLGNKSSVENIV